jgi:glucose/arabinose dehydrogenase
MAPRLIPVLLVAACAVGGSVAARGAGGAAAPAADGVKLTPVGRFRSPTYVVAPPGDVRRLFVVEKAGAIRVVVDGKVRPRPFLDLSALVRPVGAEQGLLSLAFAPAYATTGRLYVYYVDQDENARLVEYRRSARNPNVADPATAREVLKIVQPSGEHYGGHLLFGPDGYLYFGIGDGGLERNRDPMRAQRPDELHGKILRIDPRGTAPDEYRVPASNPFVGKAGWRPEIWALGFRNPWRIWIDPVTDDFYAGDVGEYVRESVEYAAAGKAAGRNFGWPCFEGGLAKPDYPPALCPGAVPPLVEYAREGVDCAVVGGVVVRDPRLPALAGRYLFSDFCGGELTSIRVRAGAARVRAVLDVGRHAGVTSFGVDARGRVYVATISGPVYRLDPRLRPAPAGEPERRGRALFRSFCGGCHTLAAAGTTGAVGPNLDEARPPRELVIQRVTAGTDVMPSFKDILSPTQIGAVADFVVSATAR